MALDSKHPQYIIAADNWQKLRDCYAGERAVKDRGLTYLPATPGQLLDGINPGERGRQNYEGYKTRAVYPSFAAEAVKAMVGVMHHKPPVIELPTALEPLRKNATVDGESLEMLLRRLNEAQLVTGRIGLLLDLPQEASAEVSFQVATYEAEKIVNWDVDLVVLDESEAERNADFQWQTVQKFRVLMSDGAYQQAQFRETVQYDPSVLQPPTVRGQSLKQIPFVFLNSADTLPDVVNPPLLPLADLCLTIYRGEADYRQNLFMQSQDTLVLIGGDKDEEYRVGAGAALYPPIGGDAKFIGVSSNGLPEQRQSLENDYRRGAQMGAQLLDTTSRAKESGEALGIRVAAQTASLNQIALSSAHALQTLLRIAAEWIGADPEQVVITPNLDFANAGMAASEFLQLTQAKAAGFPLSDESLHALAVENELTVKEFADEMALVELEKKKALELTRQEFAARPPIGQQSNSFEQ